MTGEVWDDPVAKAICRLNLIRAGIHRLQPLYVRALRICLNPHPPLVLRTQWEVPLVLILFPLGASQLWVFGV